jgi:hypothetical protein
MILDANLLFSDGQKITSTATSEVVDLTAPGDAVGQELLIRAVVGEKFTGLTSLQIKIQTSADKSAWEDVLLTPAIAAAKLTAGAELLAVRVPKGLKRYTRLNYTVSGTATAGTLTAFMSKEL